MWFVVNCIFLLYVIVEFLRLLMFFYMDWLYFLGLSIFGCEWCCYCY